MDFNSYKYLELDEQEIQKEEEEQHKEIQALLASEFYGLELDDYEDERGSDEFTPDLDEQQESLIDEDSRYDKENIFNENHDLSEPSSSWVTNPVVPLYGAPQLPSHDFRNYHQPQKNNNCYREDDVSINWEISLHGEMGIPISQNANKFYSDKRAYMATSNLAPKELQTFTNHRSGSPAITQVSPMKIIKRDVATECIPVNQRVLDNLELLYASRGKRIEQLQLELESEKEKRLRETRILNHKITLLETEQKNESTLLKSYKMETINQQQSIIDNEKTIALQSQRIVEFERENEKLTTLVEARSNVIESLNEQLTELTSRSSMARNNQKQAELLECINHQFDTDAHRFQAEISRLSERVDLKIKENERLQVQLDEQVNFYQTQKRLWSEERHKIDEELDNEKICRQKLESSINKEMVNELQGQINELTLGKSMIEDLNFYLQEEVLELTNQLLAYEQSLVVLESKECHSESDLLFDVSGTTIGRRTKSLPMLSDTDDLEKEKGNNESVTLRKEIFTLTSRTHCLTNRLLDVRRDNLDMKSSVKKLQQIINEQNEVLFVLEDKFAKTESRLIQLQSGNETDVEKQLRLSNESLETIRKSLELQCHSLLSQLKQANERMEEMDIMHRESEKELNEFKVALEEDKLTSIEEVKRACNSHFDNLRQQLEMNWMAEKEAFMVEERQLREELQMELSEALKEVDRVKNLYIQYSQQRSAEESNLTNWNEWLNKKLEEQKRSLNQQFQNDYQTKIAEIEDQHRVIVETLRSERKIEVHREDRSQGTELSTNSVGLQVTLDTSDNSCQIGGTMEDGSVQTIETLQDIEELTRNNQRLQTTLTTMKRGREQLNDRDTDTELSPSPLSPSEKFPHIVRSCTPQFSPGMVPLASRPSHSNTNTSVTSLQTLFRSLKEELVTQLMDISRSSHHRDNGTVPAVSTSEPMHSFDRVKEHLYSYILQMQARAANTLQHELQSSQNRIRSDILRQLRQILPLTLSVDGQIMDVCPDKMRVLTDKVTLILDRLQSDYSSTCHSTSAASLTRDSYRHFSATSTPLRPGTHLRDINDRQSDVTSLSSSSSSTSTASISHRSHQYNPTPVNDIVLCTRYQQLQEEIAKLSDDLLKTRTSVQPLSSLFAEVDDNWLCDDMTTLKTNDSLR